MSNFDLPHAIVFGSRSFDDWELCRDRLDYYLDDLGNIVVVTGAAKGADALGERWAYSKMHTVMRFHPDWEAHPKAAGPIRNEQMAVYVAAALGGGYAVGFWDGKSRGTADMAARCRKHGIKLKIVRF